MREKNFYKTLFFKIKKKLCQKKEKIFNKMEVQNDFKYLVDKQNPKVTNEFPKLQNLKLSFSSKKYINNKKIKKRSRNSYIIPNIISHKKNQIDTLNIKL